MKRILITFILCLVAFTAMQAQNTLYVAHSGETTAYTIANIDSIYFSSDKATMYISLKGTVTSYAVSSITGMTLGTVSTSSTAVTVVYSGTTATVTVPSSLSSVVKAETSGAGVVITSTGDAGIEYDLSGTSTNGYFRIYSDKKFTLALNSLTLTNTEGSAINSQSKKPMNIVLTGTNSLADKSGYSDANSNNEDQKGTLFSEGQILFSGTGSLTVAGNNKHAICADDYIEVDGGTITVSNAVSDGIHAKDYFIGTAGTVNLNASGDGLEVSDGYVNISGGTYTINSVDDCISASYDATDLDRYVKITGGTFSMTSTGSKGCGIKGTGDLNISGGNYTINCTGAAGKGLSFDGNISLTAGTFNITTTGAAYYDTEDKDIASSSAVKADGNLIFGENSSSNLSLTSTSTGKGGKGINVDGTLTVNGGTIDVTTSGSTFTYGSDDAKCKAIKITGNITVNAGTIKTATSNDGAEGMESKGNIYIKGGTLELTAYDDAMNASETSSSIQISGGYVFAQGNKNDGIDSNGTIKISGGVIVAIGTTSPEEGMDVDATGGITITGGTLITMGGQMNSLSSLISSSSTQHVLIYGNSATSGTIMHIQNSSGTDILDFKYPTTISSNNMIITCPSFADGSYTIYTGGSYANATTSFHGYLSGGTYTAGTSATSFTFSSSSKTTTAGTTSSSGGTQPGGGPGGH